MASVPPDVMSLLGYVMTSGSNINDSINKTRVYYF